MTWNDDVMRYHDKNDDTDVTDDTDTASCIEFSDWNLKFKYIYQDWTY